MKIKMLKKVSFVAIAGAVSTVLLGGGVEAHTCLEKAAQGGLSSDEDNAGCINELAVNDIMEGGTTGPELKV